ncbi:MAG: efflux RND transporter periplasmic adaptor subunit [Gammaproteobacteria bacterium]|nr:efflux RND transporter periplasmic adaptor subunit [Gammaproteobacteria bacterium]TVQ44622.1 MAG: efflux RND transporter periplasmic adaptor subunit [Gammaproteobacteria bacterium]
MKRKLLTLPRIILAVLALVIALPLLVGRILGPAVPALEVARGSLLQNVVTTGRVITRHRVQVGSEIVGTVREVTTDDGERVLAGEPLVVLDDALQRAGLSRAQAALRQAELRRERLGEFDRPDAQAALREARAALAQAEREAGSREQLLARNLISAEELDRSRLELERAQAVLERAELRNETLVRGGNEWQLAEQAVADARHAVELAAAELARTRIDSPVAGVVLRRRVEPGDTVQPGTPLLVISPDGRLEIEAPVDEVSLEGLAIGQPALVEADAYPGRTFEAALSFISPQVDAERGNLELRLVVDEPPAFLRQDMTVSVDIRIGERDAVLAVPNEALRDLAGDRARVWRLEGKRVEDREVTLGLRGLASSEVLSGLAEGDRVLSANAPVEAGQRVRPRTP